MEHYFVALPYRDMIITIGLDSDEFNRPPSLFEGMFSRARTDGFHLTCHCDVAQRTLMNTFAR
jgi:adenosine deaminase